MPLSYCSCTTAGRQVYMEPDPARPGKYVCAGCGAPEEAVWTTADAMQEQYTRTGVGFGQVPESLLAQATILDTPGGPLVQPFKEPSIEGQHDSGRSLAEIEAIRRELVHDY